MVFGKWKRRVEEIAEDVPVGVAPEVTDGITQANVQELGTVPAVSIDQTILAQSQAQGVLFANMVSDQQRQINAGQAATLKCAAEIFGISPDTFTKTNT